MRQERRIAWAFFILALLFLLSACGWDKEAAGTKPYTQEVTAEQIEKQAEEQVRINKLETLTPENLTAQTTEIDGKKILKNQNLFINYLKAKKVDSAQKLMVGLEELEKFSRQNGLEMNPSDIMVTISGVRSKDPSGKICQSLKENLSGNTYYKYLHKSCSPPPPPPPIKR